MVGKELNGNCIGGWVRPVREDGALRDVDIHYEDGTYPQFMDIISIPMKKYYPRSFQTENHLIDETEYWIKEGEFRPSSAHRLLDRPYSLWINGNSSHYGQNDRIRSSIACEQLSSSLLFIKVRSLEIHVVKEFNRKKTRVHFLYRNEPYTLAITDTKVEHTFRDKECGVYKYDGEKYYICISLASPHTDGFCYKLAACMKIIC